MICGHKSKSGLCKIPLRGGKCVTHDSNLSLRNKAVARSFKKKSPQAFVAQRQSAGKAGFKKRVEKYGILEALEAVRRWRLDNPSKPEKWFLWEVLARNNIHQYEREFVVDEWGHTLDIAFPDRRVGILVNGHQDKPSYGEAKPRAEKQERLIAQLTDWRIIRVPYPPKAEREAVAGQVIGQLRQFGIVQ